MYQIHVVCIDLSNQIFHVRAITSEGNFSIKQQSRRSQVLTLFFKVSSSLVGMKAYGGAHFRAGARVTSMRLSTPT